MWSHRIRFKKTVALVLIVLTSGCTSASDPTLATSTTQGSTSNGEQSQNEEVETAPGPVYAAFVDPASITDPLTHDLVYACNGLVASLEDLDQAFGSTPASEQEVAEAFAKTVTGSETDDNETGDTANPGSFSGDASTWVRLSTGWLIDRDPLTENPSSFSVLSPDGDNIVCAFRRAGFFETRPLAWSPVDDTSVAIEACIDSADVLVDLRQIDGKDVLSLFGPYDDSEEAPSPGACRVDGTNLLELGADQQVGDDVLSGLTYPFQAPSPLGFQLLGLGSTVADVSVPPVEDLTCRALDGPTEVSVAWSRMPAGISVTVTSEDEELFTAGPPRFEEAAQARVAMAARRVSYGFTDDDDVLDLDQGFDDVLAPSDRQRPYDIVLRGEGIDPITLPCGSAGAEGLGSVTAAADLPDGDLGPAAALFQASAVGPYAYMTVVAVCDGCSSTPFQLEMGPGGANGHEFVPSLDSQTDGKPGGILNPFALHRLLDEAKADGKDVSYEIDSLAGIPTVWSIDGQGARILCFEVDTAPPSLRDGTACNPAWDLVTGP